VIQRREKKKAALNVAANLKYLRLRFGYKQNQIADFLSLTRPTYSYYEAGKTEPAIDSISKLCGLYGIGIDDFFGSPEALIKRFGEETAERYRGNKVRVKQMSFRDCFEQWCADEDLCFNEENPTLRDGRPLEEFCESIREDELSDAECLCYIYEIMKNLDIDYRQILRDLKNDGRGYFRYKERFLLAGNAVDMMQRSFERRMELAGE